MSIQDINEAKQIVANYVESDDFTVETLLENSKGNFYRPWLVAAIEIKNQYEQLVKADVATFQYDKESLRGLLDTQALVDSKDDGVFSPWTIEEFLERLEGNSTISVNIH